ncbi:MAG: TRAP transporter TatT component family protein [Desulfobacterales bacterium]|nr:TRAP transporter TatT component family protein [Desulfobacterales bacterium]
MRSSRFFLHYFLMLLLTILISACAGSKTLTVGATASLLEDIAKSAYRQSDLKLIREGMPSYLMLIDGMVEAVPNNKQLLINAAQAYASFASAFIQDEDRDYARVLYARAKDYALRALEQIGVEDPASAPFEEFERRVSLLNKNEVPYLFWAASCWGNWISLSQNSIAALAELPRVELLMKKVLELDEGFYFGGAHIFMGILNGSKPKMAGGNPELARKHFLKAIELGDGKFLMTYIYYANYYAKKTFDKDLYLATLETVLQTPADIVPDLTLLNTVAQSRASKMLNEADEYF